MYSTYYNNIFNFLDAYKLGHRFQYPVGTEVVYSNLTPRSLKNYNGPGDTVVVAGIKHFLKELDEAYESLRALSWQDLVNYRKQYAIDMAPFMGCNPEDVDTQHIHDLWNTKSFPIKFFALEEGTEVKPNTPVMTFFNTDPKFYYLTNMIETWMSNTIWPIMTAATIARDYRILCDKYALETSDNAWFVDWQCHDFSLRGLSGSYTTGLGHLMFFKGTDNIPAARRMAQLYVNVEAGSVPATEHAVICAGGEISEYDTFRRLICDVYPSGIVSIVSDTWDYWNVLTSIAPSLREEIYAREGKVVFRPDSGDPLRILCGYLDSEVKKHGDEYVCLNTGILLTENEYLGSVRILDREFGAMVNSKGYRELNPKVGLIYGDSITYGIAERILERLKVMGYSSTNIVFGVGSFTYQYITRDTLGIAVKATMVRNNGEWKPIQKAPKTDSGVKKSARGFLVVDPETLELSQYEEPRFEIPNALKEV